MIKPLNNNILIKIKENENITKQGLIIRENKNDDVKIGEIIKISDYIKENYLKENSKVIFNTSDTNKFFYNNENYILIDKNKILGVIEE